MKKIFLMVGVAFVILVSSCTTSEAEKEKGAMDSIAATPNPTHTDTLRSSMDTTRTNTLKKQVL